MIFDCDPSSNIWALFGCWWIPERMKSHRNELNQLDNDFEKLVEYEQEENRRTDVSQQYLHVLSFQTQLTVTNMELQQTILEGGFGHPNGHGGHQGVSDQARQQWENIQFQVKYGIVTEGDDMGMDDNGDGDYESENKVCTICLGEYKDGENG